jgi:hypothetical protein
MQIAGNKVLRPLISLFVSGCLLVVTAAPPSIGTVKSPGEFRVDGSLIRGNSTVFDGNLIETAAARSVVELTGAQITLSPQSRAKFFRDHTVLEQGTSLVKDSNRHVVEVASLRIAPGSKDSVLQIETSSPKRVVVSARSGAAEVRNSSGILVASLVPGMALAFDPQAGASPATSMTGILKAKGSAFILTDATTNVTVELRGTDLAKYVGKKVAITGSAIGGATAVAGASQVVQVTAINAAGNGKKAAAAAGAGAAGGAAAAAGLSTAATVAIVGGVAIGGTLVGLAAAGSLSSASPISTP